MKLIDLTLLTKEIHFPIIQAIYEPLIKKPWWKKVFAFVTYRRKFEIKQEYSLWCPFLGKYIYLPAGFVFDGASVPKPLNGLYSSTGVLFFGAPPHDFGYRYKGLIHINFPTGGLYFTSYSKKELDRIFESLCTLESGMKKASWAATKTLTLFGFTGWNANRKENHDLQTDFPELYVTGDI